MSTATLPLPKLPNWKELYDQTEAFWAKPLQQVLGSDSYLAWAGTVREQALTRHQVGQDAMEAYWEAMRLPSKGDHARLAGQVVALEAKVEGLNDRLDVLTAKLDAILLAVSEAPRSEDASKSKKKGQGEA